METTLLSLPKDVIRMIMDRLRECDRAELLKVCRGLRRCASDKERALWILSEPFNRRERLRDLEKRVNDVIVSSDLPKWLVNVRLKKFDVCEVCVTKNKHTEDQCQVYKELCCLTCKTSGNSWPKHRPWAVFAKKTWMRRFFREMIGVKCACCGKIAGNSGDKSDYGCFHCNLFLCDDEQCQLNHCDYCWENFVGATDDHTCKTPQSQWMRAIAKHIDEQAKVLTLQSNGKCRYYRSGGTVLSRKGCDTCLDTVTGHENKQGSCSTWLRWARYVKPRPSTEGRTIASKLKCVSNDHPYLFIYDATKKPDPTKPLEEQVKTILTVEEYLTSGVDYD